MLYSGRMRIGLILLLVGLGPVVRAEMTDDAVDRLVPITNRDESPVLQIGLLIARSATQVKYCTAALIRNDTILTAAHCILDRLTFTLGYHLGRGTFENIPGELIKLDFPHKAGRDWALVRLLLQKPLPTPPLKMSGELPEEGINVSAYGYPYNLPEQNPGEVLHVHEDCKVVWTLEFSGEISTTCQLAKNMSGGPLILWQKDEPVIVGVASSKTPNSTFSHYASTWAVNKFWKTIAHLPFRPHFIIPVLDYRYVD